MIHPSSPLEALAIPKVKNLGGGGYLRRGAARLGEGVPREACSSRTRAAAAVSDPETAAGGGFGPVGRAAVYKKKQFHRN